ncbi:non-ribosomal peptide synthetase [Actinokineospora bangkokensis]|uniref:Non-ribosomal peptide synthetase n=1 Tax=Actinokineospora bangkokensis TaxID=1193682 RepID=A0A1Q9LLY8_9PSEU|nr:non-ribosomal peptide synthetase [Actinokineospora bangkokensis]OLR93056.1 non-ribosomal peptide synthetase [Actinokineospora bangkokensis]
MTGTLDRAALRAELLRRRLSGQAAPDDNRITPVPRDGAPLVVSSAQRRLWVLDQLGRSGTEYLMSTGLRLTGPLDAAALRTALDGLVARHEVLRTRYAVVDGEPVQVVDAPGPVPLLAVDLTDLDPAARAARLAGWMTTDRAPVDLEHGRVLTATLAALGPDEHALVITLHHIAFDEWSEQVLWRELDQRYTAATRGEEPAIAPLPVQYADYAAWQRATLTGPGLRRQLDFWRATLAGATPLDLPTDRPRPPVRDSAGDHVPVVIPADAAREVVRLARAAGATPFMALLAAFAVLLSRQAGRTDVTIGTPAAGRDRAEVQDLIGLFLNTLVLRVDLTGSPSFTDLLARVKETALAAYSHQELPFERVVDELSPVRDPSRMPLFSTMFLWADPAAGGGTFGGLATAGIPVGESDAKFDLTLGLGERPDGSLAGGFTFATSLFDRSSVVRLAAQFTELVRGLAAAPGAPVAAVPLLPADQRRLLLQDWTDTAVDYPTGTLVGLFEAQVESTPDAVALVHDGVPLTYAELNERANRLAHRLIDDGVGPESVVGVRRDRGHGLVVALLAIQKAGGAYLPLDPDYPAERLAYMCEDAGAEVVLSDPALDPADHWPAHNPGVAVHPDHPAYVIYTSGSTGRPKGVVVSHRSIVNRLHWMQDAYGLDATDRVLQKTPYGFDVSVWEFFWPLTTGATLVLARPGGHRDARYLAGLIAAEGITTLHFVPSMLRAFLAEPFGPLPSVRRVICSGEALPADLVSGVRDRIGAELHNLYGPTEAAVDVTAAACETGQPVTIGRAIANTRTYVVDEHLRPVPIGVPGELLLGGVQLARGYLGRPGLTAEKFVPDALGGTGQRLYRTGDLVRYLPDGAIDYLGRIDHQVKVRGHRVELGEVESVLGAQPGVLACAAAVHEGTLVGYVVPEPGAELDPAVLTSALRDRLPEAMIPGLWLELTALPLTTSGKTDRGQLPAPERGVSSQEYVAPRTRTEQVVVEAVAAALGVERVGVHDRFFDVGGDSIRAIRAIGALRSAGLDLSVQDVFTHQSAAELAALADSVDAVTDTLVGRFTQLRPEDRAALPEGLDDAYPMGQVQAGMVYEMLADPTAPAYQNVTSFPMSDDTAFSPDALREAARLVLDRHEILRTSFDMSGFSEPLQLVHSEVAVEVGHDDLRHLGPDEQQAVIEAYRHTMQTTPLPVTRAPQLAWHVHQTGERDWVLTHTECHAILDGWSHHSVIGELREVYLAVRDGEVDRVPAPPAARFADFVALEKAALESTEDKEFWRSRVQGFERVVLPADTAPAGSGRVEELRIPWRHLTPQLRELAASTGTSLKAVLHTAHLATLGIVTGQRRFFSGFVCNGRAELERGDEVIGMHLNTLPFAVDLDAAGTWADLLGAVFTEEVELWAHRRYPLPAMQREWGGGAPLISCIFSYLDFHVLDSQAEAIGEVADESPNEFPLNVVTFPGELRLECRPGWATEERLRAIGATFLHVLGRMVAEGGTRAVDLTGTPAHELTVPAETWPALPELCLPDLVAEQAATRPDAVAVELLDAGITYRELDERANRLAHALRALGVGPDVSVGVCMERSIEVIAAMLGVLRAGGCYVPLDPKYPTARIDFILDDAGARALITHPEHVDRFAGRIATIAVTPGWDGFDDQPATAPAVRVSPDNLAYITYTSGSTGKPKGVMVPHRGAVRLVRDPNYTTLDADQTLMLLSALAFDVSTFEIWGALANGAKLAVVPPGSPTATDLEQVISRHGVTVAWLTAGLFNALVDVRPEALSGLTQLLVGGEALSPPHVRTALEHGVPVGNGYGPTEGTVFAVARPAITVEETHKSIPIGHPVTHTRVLVVDAQLREVPFGVPGELLLGGPGVVRGYQGRPDLTAERFVPDPGVPGQRLYRTGDIVRQDPDGTLHYIGRQDHQVKIRGHRVELGEVEAAVAELPSVRAAAAAAFRGPDGVKQLVGYVVLADGAPEDLALLGDQLRGQVPDFLVPTAWVRLGSMPLNASGKLDRGALPQPTTSVAAREFSAPRTRSERAVAEVWSQVFGLERVGRHDDFFHLGGHSLLTLRIIALLRERHGIEVTVRQFLEHRTVTAIAAAVDAGEKHTRALMWLNREGTRTPLVCIHPGGGSAHWYHRLAAHLDPDLPVVAFEWPAGQYPKGKSPNTEQMAARYIRELREDVPEGPYRVFSWCGGSGVASEVAHQLKAQGEDVTFILLDPALDAGDKEHLWSEYRLIQKCVANLEQLAGAAPDEDTGALRRDTLALLEHLVDDIVGDDGITLPEHGAGEMWLPAARMWEEVMTMTMTYDHRRLPGTLHLIASDELADGEHEVTAEDQGFADYLHRWTELADEVTVRRTTGDHFSVMKEHVRELAGVVEDILGKS